MSKLNYDLKLIKAIGFDVDGVLSPSTIPLGLDGMPQRMVNTKDGYALQIAIKKGLKIIIITGANSENLTTRFKSLGISDIYINVSAKLPVFKEWLNTNNLSPQQVAFVGDDIPDLQCMKFAGLSIAPQDACIEAKQKATYISPTIGGYGVAREIIEEILRANGLWPTFDI